MEDKPERAQEPVILPKSSPKEQSEQPFGKCAQEEVKADRTAEVSGGTGTTVDVDSEPVVITRRGRGGCDTSTKICEPSYTKRLLKTCLPLGDGWFFTKSSHVKDEMPMSSLYIKTNATVQIETLVVSTGASSNYYRNGCQLKCTISVTKEEGPNQDLNIIHPILQEVNVGVPYNKNISLPVRLLDGSPLTLQADREYYVTLSFNVDMETFVINGNSSEDMAIEMEGMILKFTRNGCHVKRIGYKI